MASEDMIFNSSPIASSKNTLLVSMAICAIVFYCAWGNSAIAGDVNFLTLNKKLYQHYVAPGKLIVVIELPKGVQGTLSYWPKSSPNEKRHVMVDETWNRIRHQHHLELDSSKIYVAQLEIEGRKTRLIPLIPQQQRGEEFVFLIAGDSRNENKIHQLKVVEQMKKEDAQLYVHLGDMVTYGDSDEEWAFFFNTQKALLDKLMFLPVIGNHDLARSNILNWVFGSQNPYLGTPRYYATANGDAYFIILDSNNDIQTDDIQYDFLVDQLNKAKNQKYEHIFIFLHHPAYSSGWHKGNENIQDVISPIAEEFGVRAIFAGHEHHYERTKKINGVTYYVSGGGGSDLRSVKGDKNTAYAKSVFHYLRVSISGNKVNIKAIDQDGIIFDNANL